MLANFDKALGKFVQFEVSGIEEDVVPVLVDKPYAARHVVQRDPELRFFLGQFSASARLRSVMSVMMLT